MSLLRRDDGEAVTNLLYFYYFQYICLIIATTNVNLCYFEYIFRIIATTKVNYFFVQICILKNN
jgi:hypothetical protein